MNKQVALSIAFLLMLSISMQGFFCSAQSQVLSIGVEFVSSPPAHVNQTFEIAATVSGGTPPYTYQWYTKWFPPWKPGMDPERYRASSGNEIAVPGATSATFGFIPTVEGIYWIGVGVSDSAGNSVSRFPSIQPLQLTVNNPIPQTITVLTNSTEPIIFPSGLTVYSPTNKTYTSNIIECNGTFDCPKGYQSSLNYSIDGIDEGALLWKLDPNSIANPNIYTINGSFALPQLSNGSHQLSVGLLEQLYDNSNINSPRLINSSSWVNVICFTISTNQQNPTPPIPEFSWLALFPLLASNVFFVVKLRHRKNRIARDLEHNQTNKLPRTKFTKLTGKRSG